VWGTLRIIICDDDLQVIGQLQNYLMEYFKLRKLKHPEIQTYQNGGELLADSEKKDIVFLDIEMPGIDGICAGRVLKEQNRNTIIFVVTSYLDYLDDALRFHVFRYLPKPLDKQRLFRNLKDAIELYNSVDVKIPIETRDHVYTITTSNIIFIETQGRATIVHTLNEDYPSIHNIAHWVNTLSMPCFVQTHRSYIVNLKYVTDFDTSLIYLYDNRYRAYVTRRKFAMFKEAYFLYLESTR
jgi:two-component system LytT family response regulator